MKNIVLILTFILFQLNSFSQAPAIEWQKCFGGSSPDGAYSIEQTFDGGYIVAGYTASNNGDVSGNFQSYDYWVVKINSIGMLEWQKCLGGYNNAESAHSVKQTNDGGYIVAGESDSLNGDVTGGHGNTDYWIVKLSSTGIIEWKKAYGGFWYDEARCIELTSDNGYVVTGRSKSYEGDVSGSNSQPPVGNYDYWILKLSNNGSIMWQNALGSNSDDQANCIIQTVDGGYLIAGYSGGNSADVTGNNGLRDFWVVKLNSNGILIWQKSFGGSNIDEATSIAETSDGGFLVCGLTNSTNGNVTINYGQTDAWVIKISSIGNLIWEKTYGSAGIESFTDIQSSSEGNYVLSGRQGSNVWIVKISSGGDLIWQKNIGGTQTDYANSIKQTSDGGCIVAGGTFSSDGDVTFNNGNGDLWLVKLAPDALSNETYTENSITLSPNPTISILNLKLPNSTTIDKITITDLTGKLIQQQTQNTNVVNVENLPAGIYIIHATSAESTYHSKFVKN